MHSIRVYKKPVFPKGVIMVSPRRLSKRQKAKQIRETKNIMRVLNQKFSMAQVFPITSAQHELFESYKHKHIMAIGSAGTGKTMCSLYLTLKDILQKDKYRKLVIIRSAVQTRNQGFMPGDLNQKMSNFESPYKYLVDNLFEHDGAYDLLKRDKMIEFMSSSFIRGLTFENSIVLVDECQNYTYEELRSIITRVGTDCKIVFCGDTKQDDLKNTVHKMDVSGLKMFIRIIEQMKDFAIVKFTLNDIVRSGLVKDFLVHEELLEVA